MKNSSWISKLVLLVACLALWASARPVLAAEDNPPGLDERLQHIERRLDELSTRQDQMMRRLGARPEAGEPLPLRRRFSGGRSGPMPSPGPGLRPPLPPAGAPAPMAGGPAHEAQHLIGLIFLVCFLCNILLAIWIFLDIRKRGEGHGIFIVLALVAGIPTAIIYALVRIGDKVVVGGK